MKVRFTLVELLTFCILVYTGLVSSLWAFIPATVYLLLILFNPHWSKKTGWTFGDKIK